MDTRELLKRLEAERNAYLTTLQLVHDALAQSVPEVHIPTHHPALAHALPTATTTTSSSVHSNATDISSTPRSHKPSRLSISSNLDTSAFKLDHNGPPTSLIKSSFISGDDDEASDDDESLYVQDLLKKTSFEDEDLKVHLRTYEWDEWSRAILKSLFTRTGRVKYPQLWVEGKVGEEGAHYSLYQVFDVGVDGTPLPLHNAGKVTEGRGKDEVVWRLVKVCFVLDYLKKYGFWSGFDEYLGRRGVF